DGEVGDGAYRESEQVTDRRDYHVPDRRPRDHLLQRGREIFENHDRGGPGIAELVLELARRVERIDVYHHAPRAQDPGERDRILRDVWHHERHARAGCETPGLKPGTESRRLAVDLREAHLPVHERIGVARSKTREPIVDEMHSERYRVTSTSAGTP